MNEVDNLSATAGENDKLAVEENKSEAVSAETQDAAKKESADPSENGSEAHDDANDADAGEEAGEKKRLSGSARKSLQIQELKRELEQLRARLSDDASQPKAAPKFEDYPDFEAYETARLQFVVEQALDQKNKVDVQGRAEAAEKQWRETVVNDHVRRQAEARKVFDDYDKVIASATDPVSANVAEAVITSEKSELLQYHLAARPALVRELNALAPIDVARRIGQIEARLSYPKPRTETNAPAPVGGLKGGSSSTQFNPATASHDEMKALFARKR